MAPLSKTNENPAGVFTPLKKSISILAMDDDPIQLALYKEFVGYHPLCTVVTASSAREAKTVLQSDQTIHLCIMDLGLCDIHSDEFYLLKKYGRKKPFVIVSGAADMERAFEASTLGAVALITKPVNMGEAPFWKKVRAAFLDYVILPGLSASVNTVIAECIRVLRDENPASVSEWARRVNVTGAYLRKIWSDCYSVSPKHLLFLYGLYKSAFEQCSQLQQSPFGMTTSTVSQCNAFVSDRAKLYYLQNRRVLDSIRDG